MITLRAPALEMLGRIGPRAEASAGLDDHVDAELPPGEVRGVGRGRRDDLDSVDDERAVDSFHGAGKRPVDGVVPQQMREHLRVGDVVDRDPLEVGSRAPRPPGTQRARYDRIR